MDVPAFLAQLRAQRALCEATIWQIDAILAIADKPVEPSQTTKPNEPEGALVEEGTDLAKCIHPEQYRQPIPTMGNTSRQLCRLCKEVIA